MHRAGDFGLQVVQKGAMDPAATLDACAESNRARSALSVHARCGPDSSAQLYFLGPS